MYLLLVFLYMKSGMVEIRHSVTNSSPDCYKSAPYFEKLYTAGKFDDGPKSDTIDHVLAICQIIPGK